MSDPSRGDMLRSFYSNVLPEVGRYGVFFGPTKRHVFADTVDDLVQVTEAHADEPDTYFCLASLGPANERTTANALQRQCIAFDIDAGPQKAAKHGDKVYASQVEAIAHVVAYCKSRGLAPSYVLSSGAGLHVYFRLTRPLPAGEWKRLAQAVRNDAQAFGLKIDAAPSVNFVGVLRPPGTLHKSGARVEILSALPATYAPEELAAKFPQRVQLPTSLRPMNAEVLESSAPHSPRTIHKIVKECAAMRHAAVTRGDVPEPYWRAILGITKHCTEGVDAAHALSNGHPDYDPDETERKFERWTAGPPTCETFHGENREACEACTHWGRIKSPIVLGAVDPEGTATPCAPNGAETIPRAALVSLANSDDGNAAFDLAPFEQPTFDQVDITDLSHAEPPAPMFWVEGLLPANVVTLLGAHGGTGKSFLSLMLAVCVALGLPFLGLATRRGVVVYFSGEDPAEVVRHRLGWLLRCMRIDAAALTDRLHILDASSGDPTLFHEVIAGGRRYGATTRAFDELKAYFNTCSADVLIVDNASDAFDASEIDRARVRGFMRALANVARVRGGAVLLLAHVDKGVSRGERSGSEGYSGSTAWHNSARSRLFLSRDRADGSLTLEQQKSNLGALLPPIKLSWPKDGIPAVQVQAPVETQTVGDDARSLLHLIHEFEQRGEWVSTATTSRTNAAKLLRGQQGFPNRAKDPEVLEMLRTAERFGWLARTAYRGTDRKPRERWQVTAAGLSVIGVSGAATPRRLRGDFEVTAHGATAAEPAATAATCRAGGVGEESAHAQVPVPAHQLGPELTEETPHA